MVAANSERAEQSAISSGYSDWWGERRDGSGYEESWSVECKESPLSQVSPNLALYFNFKEKWNAMRIIYVEKKILSFEFKLEGNQIKVFTLIYAKNSLISI